MVPLPIQREPSNGQKEIRLRRFTLATILLVISSLCIWLAILRYDAQFFFGCLLVTACLGWAWFRLSKPRNIAELYHNPRNAIVTAHEVLTWILVFAAGVGLVVQHVVSHYVG